MRAGCIRTDKAIVPGHVHPVLIGLDLVVSVHSIVWILKLAQGRERRSLERYLWGRLVFGVLSSSFRILVFFMRVRMCDGERTFGLCILVGPRPLASSRHDERERGSDAARSKQAN